MSSARLFRWSGHTLVEVDEGDPADDAIAAGDSLLVSNGLAFALGLHRERFADAVNTVNMEGGTHEARDVEAFWHAAFAMIPPHGNWFPRLELRSTANESHLAYRHRLAPELTNSVTLLTHVGSDPRQVPSVKGPDIESLSVMRHTARQRGADDVVFVTSEGHVIDGAAHALVWWRGDTLCAPPSEADDTVFARVQSITAKSLLGLACALGVQTRAERATPADLDGCEVWALNALHGIRMVTNWAHGPELAERPGRITAWRNRRLALRAPIGDFAQ